MTRYCYISGLSKNRLLTCAARLVRARLDCIGGAGRDRTGGLLNANQALSQLSYSPRTLSGINLDLVGLGRFELPTSPLSGVRSNQLSYRPRKGGNVYRGRLDAASGDQRTLARNISNFPSGEPELYGLERLPLTGGASFRRNIPIISVTPATFSLRKEVIQPQVLLRLPCYDFTPIMNHTLGLLIWDF